MNLIEQADQREFLIYGFRYALGRSSYAVYSDQESVASIVRTRQRAD